MKKTTGLIICCLFVLVSGVDVSTRNEPVKSSNPNQENVNASNIPKISTNEQPNSKKAEAPITVIPVPTSTPSTTTSTTLSTTSSTTTTSTTPSSTTSTTTTSTTPSSTTSTTTSTPPVPVPDPTSNKWIWNGTDNLIIVKMAVQLVINYKDSQNKSSSQAIDVPVGNNTYIFGKCNKYNESMQLSWKSVGTKNNSLTLQFQRDNATYVLSTLQVTIQPEELPNSGLKSPLMLVNTQKFYNTSLGNSYRCVKLQTFNLTKENDDKLILGQVKVTDLQFQAFKTDIKNKSFGYAKDCAFDTPDEVPIAVGIILAGLVVTVLVTYLIKRRRSQGQGYHSM